MLKKILNQKTCAGCKTCCVFDKSDEWEIPLISKELKEEIEKQEPRRYNFIPKGNCYVLSMEYEEDGLTRCPMLGENGCRLGDNKPFDCRVWPFRVMRLNNMEVITVSPVCDYISGLPLSTLSDFLNNGFADKLYNAAENMPDMVKDYIDGYPILSVKQHD